MSVKHRRKPYMPDSDSGKKTWMERFITQLERDPARYGFDPRHPRMFEHIQRTIRTFIKAADKTLAKGQRSPSAVAEKNRARKEAVKLCRDLAMKLKWDQSLEDADKRALGLHVDDAPPEEAKLPQGIMAGTLGFPTLAVVSSPNGGHVIRYFDINAPSKAKPRGVSHFVLFGAIGRKPRLPITQAQLMQHYTKRPFEVMYPVGCGLEGLYVTYYGRWLTTRGEMSPWSRGVSKIIGETQVSLRECPFAHLFGKDGIVNALPAAETDGAMNGQMRIDERRPLLQGEANEEGGLFAALGHQMLEATRVRVLNAA